jgi:hypothetical protein
MKGKLGRSTVLTQDVIAAVCAIIAKGNTFRTACQAVAISEEAFYKRLQRDVSFRQKVALAKAQAKQRIVSKIELASNEDWRAGAWLMERTYRDEYGKQWADEHPASSVNITINADEHARRLREIFGVKPAKVIDVPALPDCDNGADASDVS